MRIQHNILAMNAYRNYTNNVTALGKNLERLSSGYKINRAGDDAAGLAISEKMRAQITGLNAAQKNVKDGISLVKTAEGAMQEIQDMLNRMDYLATQSANGTYDNETDRAALQKEVEQLKSEINRIAESANFNGISLLDGSLDASVKTTGLSDVEITHLADGQLGEEAQAGIYSFDFSNTTIEAAEETDVSLMVLGQNVTITIAAGEKLSGAELAQKFADEWNKGDDDYSNTWADDSDGGFTVKATVEGDKLVLTMSNPPKSLASFNQYQDSTAGDGTIEGNGAGKNGVLTIAGNATGNNAEQVAFTVDQRAVDTSMGRMYAQGSFKLVSADDASGDAGEVVVADGTTLTIGGETYVFAVGPNSKYKDMDNVIDLTDKKADAADLAKVAAQRLSKAAENNASFKVGSNISDGVITLTEKEGGVDYTVNDLVGEDGYGTKGNPAAVDDDGNNPIESDVEEGAWAGLVKVGKVDTANMGKALTLQIGDTSESYNQLKVKVGDMHTTAMGIANLDISSADSAASAINVIRNAINYVSGVRGDLGATQNRLEHTQNNLSVMAENIQDAESTIRDTDVAEEMMSYVKNNILVQSAQAMLAQANQVPQGVLQLLG